MPEETGFRSVMSVPSRTGRRLSPAGARPAPPATLVIFGALGDLTKRLLIPALYNLRGGGLLDDGFRVIGVDRAESDAGRWRAELGAAMQDFTKDPTAEFYVEHVDETVWGWVAERLSYVRADFTNDADMQRLAGMIHGDTVFYLAIPGRFFGKAVEQLGRAGLLAEKDGFRRVVIEKPFGQDLESAKALNRTVLAHAREDQVFRIDHFLGKETVQNIMALRFANGVFEPIWRREYIEYVEITAAETIGVELRGAFYEPTGALRDMVPNHLFQLLCMVTMEPPNSFAAEAVRNEKAKLIESVKPVRVEDVVRGQYGAGTVMGQQVRAYRDEPNVARDSRTETYIALRLFVDNWRWGGVPFYLRTGKRLHAHRTEVRIHFRPPPFRLFHGTGIEQLTPNILSLNIQPYEGLTFSLSAKQPGPLMRLAGIDLRFRYQDAFKTVPNVGYETLIYDCLIGDPTLFQRADMIEASWAAVQPVLDAAKAGLAEPEIYTAGSDGPAGADRLLAGSGHAWHRLDEPEPGPAPEPSGTPADSG